MSFNSVKKVSNKAFTKWHVSASKPCKDDYWFKSSLQGNHEFLQPVVFMWSDGYLVLVTPIYGVNLSAKYLALTDGMSRNITIAFDVKKLMHTWEWDMYTPLILKRSATNRGASSLQFDSENLKHPKETNLVCPRYSIDLKSTANSSFELESSLFDTISA